MIVLSRDVSTLVSTLTASASVASDIANPHDAGLISINIPIANTTAIMVAIIYIPITLTPILPSCDKSLNWDIHDTMEKKTTGAMMILSELINMLFKGISA